MSGISAEDNRIVAFSHASSRALGTAVSVGPPLWSRMKYPGNCSMDCYKMWADCVDVHDPQRIKPTDVGDPLTFYLIFLSSSGFLHHQQVPSEISEHPNIVIVNMLAAGLKYLCMQVQPHSSVTGCGLQTLYITYQWQTACTAYQLSYCANTCQSNCNFWMPLPNTFHEVTAKCFS